ncbi:MAG: hypothetical protein ABIS20_12280 [Thermoanaerobaculia bacterium]
MADLAEFKSKVTRQGTMLCFPLGKSLGIALKRYGFIPGQPVVVRFDRERLEIRPLNTPEEVRDKLRLAGGELKAFRNRMRALAKDLPPVSDEELEGEASLEGELLGLLECLLSDDLDPAIQKLEGVDELGPVSPAQEARRPGKAARKRNEDRS